MADAGVKFREFRFVIEDELTQVFVLCEAIGDCPLGVQGWHHKTFSPSKSVMDIIGAMFKEVPRDDPLLWSQEAPDA